MSKPYNTERIWPDLDIGHRTVRLQPIVAQLSEKILLDLRGTGVDIPGAVYFGRTPTAITAQGRAIFDHYRDICLSAQPLLAKAAALAINQRLIELEHPTRITEAAVIREVIPEKPERWTPRTEPVALYLNRLKSNVDARAYVDSDPLTSYTAVDKFLADNPSRQDLHVGQPVVMYLAEHPTLDDDRQYLFGAAVSLIYERVGLSVVN